jgi:undecaprenyl-diphosphatase
MLPIPLEPTADERRRLVRRETILATTFLGISALLLVTVVAGATQRFDQQALDAFKRLRTERLDVFVEQVTALGNLVTLVVFSVGIAITLRFAMNLREIGFIVASIVGGRVLHVVLRALVDRTRPQAIDTIFSIDSSSFPSGHAMMSAIVYPTFALLLAELIENSWARNTIIAGSFLLAAAIGVSRLYLGVHYVTDVIAGWSAGLFWLSACWEFRAHRLHRRRIAG